MQFNPFDPDTIQDPYPAYAQLRQDDPVHHSDLFGFWILSRFDDVREALKNPGVFSSERGMGELFKQALGADLTMSRSDGTTKNILASDPPVHTRLRTLVNRVFTPKAIKPWEDEVRAIANKCVDDLLEAADGGPVDLVEKLCTPLPGTMIAVMLGIEQERRADFKQWCDDLLTGLAMGAEPEKVRSAGQALNEYLDKIVEDRQRNPGSDLVSLLVNKGSEGEEPLTFDEMVGFATILLIGGTETTTNFIGNWVSAMFENREYLDAVRADPQQIAPTLEEAFRYDTPTLIVWRGTTADVKVSGVQIPEGAQVGLLLGSANRDEAKWGEDAGRFRPGREATGHVAFGFGPHLCLGSQLARLEAKTAVETLLERTSSIEPAGPPVRTTNFMLRGFTEMPVTIKQAG